MSIDFGSAENIYSISHTDHKRARAGRLNTVLWSVAEQKPVWQIIHFRLFELLQFHTTKLKCGMLLSRATCLSFPNTTPSSGATLPPSCGYCSVTTSGTAKSTSRFSIPVQIETQTVIRLFLTRSQITNETNLSMLGFLF